LLEHGTHIVYNLAGQSTGALSVNIPWEEVFDYLDLRCRITIQLSLPIVDGEACPLSEELVMLLHDWRSSCEGAASI
jgi:hypothetical protein